MLRPRRRPMRSPSLMRLRRRRMSPRRRPIESEDSEDGAKEDPRI